MTIAFINNILDHCYFAVDETTVMSLIPDMLEKIDCTEQLSDLMSIIIEQLNFSIEKTTAAKTKASNT